MKLNEHEKHILKDLKQGEPFSYRSLDGELYIGVRCGYDKNKDEYQVFRCFDYKPVAGGLIKKQLSKKIKRKVICVFGKFDKTSDFVLEPLCDCKECKKKLKNGEYLEIEGEAQ